MADIRNPTLSFDEAGSVTGDTFEVRHWKREFQFSLDQPWAGDSETGFGQTLDHNLTLDQAIELAEWLLGRAALAKGGDGR